MKSRSEPPQQILAEWDAMEQGKPCPWCGCVVRYWKCLATIACYLKQFWARKELAPPPKPMYQVINEHKRGMTGKSS
jgi:hypothetical protein